MSIEQYKALAVQEESYPDSFVSLVQHYWAALVSSTRRTPLEQLLFDDDETFKAPLTTKYGQYIHLEDVGDVFTLDIPHPTKDNDVPIVVFIHGLGGNLQQFDYQIEEFSQFAHIVALDLPGSGHSVNYEKDKFKLTLENFANVVESILKRLNCYDKKIILVGHSYGTQVCIKLCNSLPQVVTTVFLAPPKIGFKRTRWQTYILQFFLQFPWAFNIFRKLDRVNNIESHSLKRLFAKDTTASDFIKFKQFNFNISTNSENVLTHALGWVPLTVEEILEMYSQLTKNNAQLVVLDGAQDAVTHNGGATYRDLLGSRVEYIELENTGHNMPMEQPNQINEILKHVFLQCDSRLSKDHVE